MKEGRLYNENQLCQVRRSIEKNMFQVAYKSCLIIWKFPCHFLDKKGITKNGSSPDWILFNEAKKTSFEEVMKLSFLLISFSL